MTSLDLMSNSKVASLGEMSNLYSNYSWLIILDINSFPLSHRLCLSCAFQMWYVGSKFNMNGKEEEEGWGKEKIFSLCFCIQGMSPLPCCHIRESRPISTFITQHFPPPRIYNSAILICFGGTQQSDSLSERKFVLLENICEQLIWQLYFRPWEVNA